MRIELKNLHHVYSPGTDFAVEALRGVSLVVNPEEILCVVGGTGSGKSTLVQHLNLLLEPTSGEVLVDGEDAFGMKKSELRRRVGFVFQFPEAALFAPTVEEDVAFAPGRMGLGEEETKRRASEALELLEVGHLAGRSPYALSGGEKRRVAIAGILAMRPEVVVLDEPTSGLDPAGRESLLGVIVGLKESGVSVVLVSHDLNEVAEVADRVCLMDGGEVVAVGPAEEVFYANPRSAPDTVRTVAEVLRASPGSLVEIPKSGRPVRFRETVDALEEIIGDGRWPGR